VGEDELLELELVTPVALKTEISAFGDEVRHAFCSKGLRYIAVRRDKSELPVVIVISRKSSSIVNCYGVSSNPDKGSMVIEFAEREGLRIDVSHISLGFVLDKAGHVHRLDDLPADLHIDGDFEVHRNSVKRWPRRLVVDGNLSVPGLTGDFCDELVVSGRLSIPDASIKELPRRTVVGGDLFADRSRLTRIRGDEEIAGSLFLSDSAIESLPGNFQVKGSLAVSRTRLRELPAGLEVQTDFSCRGNAIEVIPDDITVGGGIWLAYSKVTRLPVDLVCGGLDISRTAIVTLPEGTHIRGPLQAEESALSRISALCIVEGDMELAHSRLRSLPSDLKAGGSVDLTGTQVERIPDGFRVGGDLLLPCTPIRSLPPSLFVPGKLDLRYTEMTKTDIPESIEVLGYIYVNNWAANKRRDSGWFSRFLRRLFSRGASARA
jgi:hypothetical protein